MPDFSSLLSSDLSLPMLFLYGVLTSFHCVVMCGGFALSGAGRIRSAVFYNVGRLVSYASIGALAGGLGRFFAFTGGFKCVLPLCGGFALVLMGLNFTGVFRKLKLRPPSFALWLARHLPQNMFFLGLLTALLPCGPVQAMQFYCLGTGNAVKAAISMALFTLGTIPVLFILGSTGSIIPPRFNRVVARIGGIIILYMGIMMVVRGITLSGIEPELTRFFPRKPTTEYALVRGGMQLLVTDFTPSSYPSVRFEKGVPAKWIIHVDKKYVGMCTATIDAPQFGIRAQFHAGDNVFEFFPDTEGDFPYHSWCGMISNIVRIKKLEERRAQ